MLEFGHAPDVISLLDKCQELPEELRPQGDDRFVYDKTLTIIGLAVERWKQGDRHATLRPLKGKDARLIHPITVIRTVLENCPDDPVAATVSELAFITDPDIREDLGQDIEEAKRALASRDWKGATVVAGSVIEGLLLWALDQKTEAERQAAIATVTARSRWRSPPPKALEDWKLFQFVAVAADLGLIDGETEKQADLARDFRNYIHPGRVKTKGKKCDEKTALLTRSAVLGVIEDLKKRFP